MAPTNVFGSLHELVSVERGVRRELGEAKKHVYNAQCYVRDELTGALTPEQHELLTRFLGDAMTSLKRVVGD
jgi:hypothetical protein